MSSNAAWVWPTLSGGTHSSVQVPIRIDPRGLSAGRYYANLRVNGNFGDRYIPVELWVESPLHRTFLPLLK
jgi:hypothetical protein